jgi:hypothetical protein
MVTSEKKFKDIEKGIENRDHDNFILWILENAYNNLVFKSSIANIDNLNVISKIIFSLSTE